MEILYSYAATTQEVLDWARKRLPAEISTEVQEQLLAMVREIRDSDERHTIATLAKALGRDIGSLESDLLYLQQLHIVEVSWTDRLPDIPDELHGWDDGAIFYYPPPPGRREIAVQEDLELYLLLLQLCRCRFGGQTSTEADKRRRRKELLFLLFSEIRGYEDLLSVRPHRNEMRIEFAPHGYEGDSRELLYLLDLLREPEIIDVDVCYARAITHDLRSGSRQPSTTVSVEIRWRPGGEGFVPLWKAVKRVWPTIWLEWAHADLYRKGLEVIGDEETFRGWLKIPIASAGGRTPLEILAEEDGVEAFLNLLSSSKRGSRV